MLRLLLPLLLVGGVAVAAAPRPRQLGVVIGMLPPGPHNAITDVPGVRVGHATLVEGEEVRTGVTVVLPHPGNLFQDKVPAAVAVFNGFGKLIGLSQVRELGALETPIALTSTLSVWRVADALAEWTLEQPGNQEVISVNPVVGECNDAHLSDIRRRPVGRSELRQALAAAAAGPVAEGSVGAGTGTVCLGWKGGIGTSSRRLPASLGGFTVGVLVQTNFGGALTIAGVPVGQLLGRYSFKQALDADSGGSCMIVVATDAPLDARQLERLAARAPLGLARAGSSGSGGSGDYAIAFSAHPEVRLRHGERQPRPAPRLGDDALSPLFLAVIEATEEAVVNSLFAATSVTGRGRTVDALPVAQVLDLLRARGALREPE